MSPLKIMKEELKDLAAQIREANRAHREGQRAASAWDLAHPKEYKERWNIYNKVPAPAGCMSQEYRYKHVAYCLARGRKYEEIERKVTEGNEIDMLRVEKIVKKVQDEQATFCASQIRPVA